jgi:hypothetical protein
MAPWNSGMAIGVDAVADAMLVAAVVGDSQPVQRMAMAISGGVG